jgi:hypothetical protein
MEKQDLIIKEEKEASRCEICHKEDMFNIETQSCSRCFEYKNLTLGFDPLKKYTIFEKQKLFESLNKTYQKNLLLENNIDKQYQLQIELLGIFKSIVILCCFLIFFALATCTSLGIYLFFFLFLVFFIKVIVSLTQKY